MSSFVRVLVGTIRNSQGPIIRTRTVTPIVGRQLDGIGRPIKSSGGYGYTAHPPSVYFAAANSSRSAYTGSYLSGSSRSRSTRPIDPYGGADRRRSRREQSRHQGLRQSSRSHQRDTRYVLDEYGELRDRNYDDYRRREESRYDARTDPKTRQHKRNKRRDNGSRRGDDNRGRSRKGPTERNHMSGADGMGTGHQGAGGNGTGHTVKQTTTNQANHNQPKTNHPKTNQPKTTQPKTTQPNANRPQTNGNAGNNGNTMNTGNGNGPHNAGGKPHAGHPYVNAGIGHVTPGPGNNYGNQGNFNAGNRNNVSHPAVNTIPGTTNTAAGPIVIDNSPPAPHYADAPVCPPPRDLVGSVQWLRASQGRQLPDSHLTVKPPPDPNGLVPRHGQPSLPATLEQLQTWADSIGYRSWR